MRNVVTFFQLLPKPHQKILGVLSFFVLLLLVFPLDYANASRNAVTLEVNKRYPIDLNLEQSKKQAKRVSLDVSGKPDLVAKPSDTLLSFVPRSYYDYEQEHTVKKGDSLATIFQAANINSNDIFEISELKQTKKHLKRIKPGQQVFISQDDNHSLLRMRYRFDSDKELIVERTNNGFQERVIERKIEKRMHFAGAVIEDNFWNAATQAELSPSQIMELANIFGWDIDFALDIRKGDSFSVLYEERYADGVFVGHGSIIAADFINQDQHFKAVRYQDGEYYNEDGRSMRKAFLRSPVDFTRVSSGFSLRRLHPVTGRVKPHRGVDYAAKTGTPVKAAGNGRIIASGYNKYNGNYIFIKHNSTYTTKYLHLHKRYVRRGKSVKQGQIIGTVGKTGWATGSHLHYEFIVNGVHRNPRTVKLPRPKKITKVQRPYFFEWSSKILNKLNHHKQVTLAQIYEE